jgi:putative transposase
MTNIRRFWDSGFPYFITHVTYNRAPILIDNIDLWQEAVQFTKDMIPFNLMAWVVLPDHIHLLVDPADSDLTYLSKRLKMKFSGQYRARYKYHDGRVWQYRFWDHKIRDEKDFKRHFDYIHYNPVKHGIVSRPIEYIHSSFNKYYDMGHYSADWGVEKLQYLSGDYGE